MVNLVESLVPNNEEIYGDTSLNSRDNTEPVPEHVYEILHTPELRARYTTLTDELVRKMVEDQTEVAIFLDKSARPVAWMVEDLWDTLVSPQRDGGEILKRPKIKFLNVDREQWGAVVGRTEDPAGMHLERVPRERIDELRAIFAPLESDKSGKKSLLEGKNVMVIDEVRTSGDTLSMAEGFLNMAYPEAAKITAAYWMNKPMKRLPDGNIINSEVPVWYGDDRHPTGRLIANRDSAKSRSSSSERQRVGEYWLSTRFKEGVDQEGINLKNDIKQMAQDLADHNLPYMPSPVYDYDDVVNRIPFLNPGVSMDNYTDMIRETNFGEESVARFIEVYTTRYVGNAAVKGSETGL